MVATQPNRAPFSFSLPLSQTLRYAVSVALMTLYSIARLCNWYPTNTDNPSLSPSLVLALLLAAFASTFCCCLFQKSKTTATVTAVSQRRRRCGYVSFHFCNGWMSILAMMVVVVTQVTSHWNLGVAVSAAAYPPTITTTVTPTTTTTTSTTITTRTKSVFKTRSTPSSLLVPTTQLRHMLPLPTRMHYRRTALFTNTMERYFMKAPSKWKAI